MYSMPEGMKFKLENIEAEREAAFALVRELEQFGARVTIPESGKRNMGALSFQVTFPFQNEGAEVNIFLLLKDWQVDSDVVITNMTTLPEDKRGVGLGGKALKFILDWATSHHFDVCATQVGDPRSEKFWTDNGFALSQGANPTHDLVYRKSEATSSGNTPVA
ncbi:MAG: hypothetical protein UY50_C0010G0018 [Parcubacteria group bacterium GW2011_GWA2_49_9]|nr:MAG: hypothetical protein UY50_C0010G0018 [Parcubacteria group bacterium GW2011_GWA2_49_9]